MKPNQTKKFYFASSFFRKMFLAILVLPFTLSFSVALGEKTPVVLVHGILSSVDELTEAKAWFASNLDCEIFSIEVGDGKLDSITKPMSWQLEALTYTINSIAPLRDQKFHLIGFSQGGLLARAFAETSEAWRVKTLMTFGTPHMGIYLYSDPSIYSVKSQSELSFANYYKDPFNIPLYLRNCTFLPIINGEVDSGLTLYNKVDNFVMVWSPLDEVIRPKESGKYEYYMENSFTIVPLLLSETFNKNYAGIRSMFTENRVQFVETDCGHREFKSVDCLEKYKEPILRFLK